MPTMDLLPALAVGGVTTVALALAGVWARARPELRRPIVGLVLVFLLAPILGRTALGADSVAPQHVNMLHEDTTFGVLDRISRPWTWSSQTRWMVGSAQADRGLEGQVAANRLIHGLTLATLLVLLRGFFSAWWPALWIVAVGGLGALPLSVASSETWTPVIWLASSLAGVGLVTTRHAGLPMWSRWLGGVLVLLLGAWIGPRTELLLMWLLAALAAWWPLLLPAPLRLRLMRRVALLSRRPARAPMVALVILILLALVQGLLSARATPGLVQSLHDATGADIPHLWLRAALALLPTDVSFLLLPSTLSLATPLTFVGFVIVGAWAVAVHERRWLWLLVGSATLFKVYWAVGHGHLFESQRYLSNLLVPLIAIGALGLRALIPWISGLRDRPRQWRGALALLILLSLVDGRYGMETSPWTRWPAGATLERNHQHNARLLAAVVHRWPACAFVTRSDDRVGASSRVVEEPLVIWGANWPVRRVGGAWPGRDAAANPRGVGKSDEELLPEVLAALHPRPSCVLAVSGLACALHGSGGCAMLREGEALHTEHHRNRAYRHAHFGVAEGAVLTFTVHPLRLMGVR